MENQEQYQFDATEQFVELIDRLFINANYVDCHALLCEHRESILEDSLDCEGWFFLRHGQVLFELNKPEESKEALSKAFSIDGFDLFSDEKEVYLTHIQVFVDKRIKAYNICGALCIGALPAFISVLLVLDYLVGIDRDTLCHPWVFTGFFVFFLALMLASAYLSPYSSSGTSSASGDIVGPVD